MASRTAKGDLGAQHDIALHARTAQIDVAILEARVFGDLDVILHGKWRCERRIEYPDAVGDDFDFAGREIRIGVFGRAPRDLTFDGDHIFRADLFSAFVHIFRHAGLEDDLGDAVAVAEIGEDDRTVVAAPVDPSHQDGALAGISGAKLSAGVCAA